MAAGTDFPLADEQEPPSLPPQPLAAGGGRRGPRRPNMFARIQNYYREIVAELRKVIYPSRSELITYVTVVMVFVTFMVAAVAGLDYLFTKLDLSVFG